VKIPVLPDLVLLGLVIPLVCLVLYVVVAKAGKLSYCTLKMTPLSNKVRPFFLPQLLGLFCGGIAAGCYFAAEKLTKFSVYPFLQSGTLCSEEALQGVNIRILGGWWLVSLGLFSAAVGAVTCIGGLLMYLGRLAGKVKPTSPTSNSSAKANAAIAQQPLTKALNPLGFFLGLGAVMALKNHHNKKASKAPMKRGASKGRSSSSAGGKGSKKKRS